MNNIRVFLSRVKEYGLLYVLKIIYKNKLVRPVNRGVQTVCNYIFRKSKLKDVIIIESHNDFDCNGGAFYEYLINNGYNEKYSIIWLIKNKPPKNLPSNVKCFNIFRPSFKKSYYICVAKYFTADNVITDKVKKEQKSFFLTHGAGGFKNIKGKMVIPNSVDYILLQSEKYAPIQAYQYSLEWPSDRIVFLGYPGHDILNSNDNNEVIKVTSTKYKKVILWMPTFRKGGGEWRNDSAVEQPLGIPLINSFDEYAEINEYLKCNDALLIIKIHPMQEKTTVKIKGLSNIAVLTKDDVKRLGVDNYRLMSCVDALISDYSGAAYEFLQVNKPIAYITSDIDDYKIGFVVDDITELMGGQQISTISDFKKFLYDVFIGCDIYMNKRTSIREYIYKYNDADNCRRLADFMGLEKQRSL